MHKYLLAAAFLLTAAVFADSIVKQPPAGTFEMRKELEGHHPRLYFTKKDIPRIRKLAAGPNKWYVDRLKKSFGSRYGKDVKAKMAGWERYIYGLWGLSGAAILHAAEGKPVYADTVKKWVAYHLAQPDWGGDDLIPMDIVSGVAIAYDILYDKFTPDERKAIRDRLFKEIRFISKRFFVGQYWTSDYQNNHMHNRLHGLANAVFAIYGDDPALDLQPYADLAFDGARQIAAWVPEDGSQHEGPGYWSYGHHWLVRLMHLVEHVTGEEVAETNRHFSEAAYFRLYMTAPGWKKTLGIGDSGDGPPSNLTCLARIAAEAQDPVIQAWTQKMMEINEGEFYQHPAWGILWYDARLKPQPFTGLPLWRFWPDLEMFSIRSSWADDAAAFVFKCGPPGGHRLQTMRKGGWANVAHDHPDQNHFLLFKNGVMLAEDDGYPKQKKLTRSHNTITVDGKGQPREGTGWQQPFPYDKTGYLQDVFLAGAWACAAGDGHRLYDGADRFIRQVLFAQGDYVILRDELTGAGGKEHEFEWRLHKDGNWKDEGRGLFRVADKKEPAVGLEIRFLQPSADKIKGDFLPAELTARPCLSIKQKAAAAQFVCVLVPQKGKTPAMEVQSLPCRQGTAVEVKGPSFRDIVILAGKTNQAKAGKHLLGGAGGAARMDAKGNPHTVLLMRGTVLKVDGKMVLSASKPANIARLPGKGEVRVEAEAPYKTRGGKTTLKVGGFRKGRRCRVKINDEKPVSVKSDGSGLLKLNLDLKTRCRVVITGG